MQGAGLEAATTYVRKLEVIQGLYATLAEKVPATVLADLSAVAGYRDGNDRLAGLVAQSATLGELSRASDDLKRLQEQFAQLAQTLPAIEAAIGAEPTQHLGVTESGLRELYLLMEIVASLKPALWRLRHERFDNDELDDVLPGLRDQLEALQALHEELRATYNVAALPSKGELENLRATLENRDAFRWFRRSWRTAKRGLLGYAANPNVKFSAMAGLLDKARAFSEQQEELDGHETYRELLGEHLKGLQTNVPALEALRAWYRRVRQTYGVGFGPKVAIGRAILGMPADVGKAIRSLGERGILKQLGQNLKTLTRVKAVFAPDVEAQRGDVPLIGEEGLLKRLLSSLTAALQRCGDLAGDSTLSLSELAKHIRALETLRDEAAAWTHEDVDSVLFGGRLGLRVGAKADNTHGIARAKRTLELARILCQDVCNEVVRRFVLEEPHAATFDRLRTAAVGLEAALSDEVAKGQSFANLVELNRDAWFEACGDVVEGMIERNHKGRNRPGAPVRD